MKNSNQKNGYARNLCGVLTTTAMVVAFLLTPLTADAATDYTVGSGGSYDYSSLDDLQSAVSPLTNGDKIILYNDDNSLTDAIEISSGSFVTLVMQGHKITMTSGDAFTIHVNSILIIDGEGTINGVISGDGELRKAGTGILRFPEIILTKAGRVC